MVAVKLPAMPSAPMVSEPAPPLSWSSVTGVLASVLTFTVVPGQRERVDDRVADQRCGPG